MTHDSPGQVAPLTDLLSGHQPVLLPEAVALLAPRSGGRYLDGTFGGGGHTRAILDAAKPDGRVLAIDADPAAVQRGAAMRDEEHLDQRLTVARGNFRDLAAIAREHDFAPLDGVLLDLGFSSYQMDDADRGFAIRLDGPLDMRFAPDVEPSAATIVNTYDEPALAHLIWTFGEDPASRRIARAIVRAREQAPIETTSELATIIEQAAGGRRGAPIHPATRAFQALRIAVNDELGALEDALQGAADILAPGGRLVVISFHSLEDRMVKQFMVRESATCVCPPGLPVCVCGHQPRFRQITRKPVRPTADETATNPRARSALLRAVERLAPGNLSR